MIVFVVAKDGNAVLKILANFVSPSHRLYRSK